MKQKTSSQTGEAKVQALIDALAGDAGAEKTAFGQLLLARFGTGNRQVGQASGDLEAFDLLLEITRLMLEGELENALVQFERHDLNRTEINRQAALFWGALSLHAKLFLRMPAPGYAPLAEEVGGQLVVRQEGAPPYSFQEPLSAARLKSLFASLGSDWLTRYLNACIVNKKISQLFHDMKQRQKIITEWIGLVSVRTLERAQKQVRSRLWDQHGDEDKRKPARPGQRELAPTIRLQSPTLPSQPDILEIYTKALAKKLSHFDSRLFVCPEMQVEDQAGDTAPASPEDLIDIQGLCLLAGLPGGGKSYLQAWAARNRQSEGRGLDIFVNLDEYARSGLSSLFEFAADRLRRDFSLPAGQDELRSALIELDRQGEIVWRVDNWDRLRQDERDRALVGIAGLTNGLISTADSQELIRLAQQRSLDFPQQMYHVLPWSRAKQEEYLALYEQVHTRFQRDLALSLMEQLPGLARLPVGIVHILARKEPGLVEALLDYLDARQKARGNTGITLRLGSNRSHQTVDWVSADLNAIYSGVSALMQHGLGRRYEPLRLEQFDRVILGACLPEKRESLEARMQEADEILKTGVRSGLLVRVGSNQFEFVVPEIGYLMAALAVNGANSAGYVQGQAQNVAGSHPGTPAAVLADFYRWVQATLHKT